MITTPPEGLAREVLPLTTGVDILHGVNTGTPFVVPPALDMERPVMQLHDFLTYRTSESCQSSLLLSLSASSSALTLPRNPAKFSSSSFSLDLFQPLRGKTSPPTGEALLPPPADDCLVPGLDDPNTAVWCEPFLGSESPSSLPACATVRAVLSAGPSGAPDWVGFQDLYDTARGIFDLCNARGPGGGRVRTVWTAESFMQVSTCTQQIAPGLWIAAASYSGPGHCRMSGVAPALVLACCSRSDYEYCARGISLPRSDCVVQLLLLHYQLDSYPYDLMIEFVGDWCFA